MGGVLGRDGGTGRSIYWLRGEEGGEWRVRRYTDDSLSEPHLLWGREAGERHGELHHVTNSLT